MFHIGVRNLPAGQARDLAASMTQVTANPARALIAEMLAALANLPDVLVVLNHPYSNAPRTADSARVPFDAREGDGVENGLMAIRRLPALRPSG